MHAGQMIAKTIHRAVRLAAQIAACVPKVHVSVAGQRVDRHIPAATDFAAKWCICRDRFVGQAGWRGSWHASEVKATAVRQRGRHGEVLNHVEIVHAGTCEQFQAVTSQGKREARKSLAVCQ